jgi:hypothetical protein
MAKQWTELERLVIPKGCNKSNTTSLHPKTGTIATITIYGPDGHVSAFVYVSADGERFCPFVHRGKPVQVEPRSACDIPLPACRAMRLETISPVDGELAFQVLALLEVD